MIIVLLLSIIATVSAVKLESVLHQMEEASK